MRASRDMRDIRGLVRQAQEPEKIRRLVEILDHNHGYRLYQSVSRLKEALSSDETATFHFEAGDVRIEKPVTRRAFEGWIAPELAAIAGAADEALARAGLVPSDVDKVFPHRRLVVRPRGAAAVRRPLRRRRSWRAAANWCRSPPVWH